LGSAIIFDSFDETKSLVALNHLNTIIPSVMAVAPLAGGYLNENFGFKANFFAIAATVFLSWVISLLTFKETLAESQRKPLVPAKLASDFKRVCFSFEFWQMNLPVCLLFGGYLAFLSISAVLFVVEFKISKTVYPFFQAAILGGWLVASISSSWCMKKWGAQNTKKAGICILASSFVGFQLACWIAPRNPYWMTAFMVFYSFGFNWVQVPYFGEIMGLMPDIKGILGSVVTSCRLLLTAGVVAFSGHFYDKSIDSFSMAMAGIALIVGPMIWLRERNRIGEVYEADSLIIQH
jgi:DHA1 family bicyclomycin/chloramphenicol resistance-like MFS transporter